MIKKFIKTILYSSLMIVLSWTVCFALPPYDSTTSEWFDFPFKDSTYSKNIANASKTNCDSTNLWDCVDIKDNSIMAKLLNVFWLNNDTLKSWDNKFIIYVRGILNIALSLLSMIALVMTIYTFYMMFFTDNEAWAKQAKGNLVGIFIALAIIWLSWLIVSFIFWWYQSNWQSALNAWWN